MLKHKEQLTEHEQEFVDAETRFINGWLYHKKAVAEAMAQDHRYLLGQKTELYIEFLKAMSKYERKGLYDARDEWACKAARVAVDALVKAELLYIPYDEREEFGLSNAA